MFSSSEYIVTREGRSPPVLDPLKSVGSLENNNGLSSNNTGKNKEKNFYANL
jgi:hypothetical protein